MSPGNSSLCRTGRESVRKKHLLRQGECASVSPMTPFQEALLAIDIAVDALHEANHGNIPMMYLEQIKHLGLDTRRSETGRRQSLLNSGPVENQFSQHCSDTSPPRATDL